MHMLEDELLLFSLHVDAWEELAGGADIECADPIESFAFGSLGEVDTNVIVIWLQGILDDEDWDSEKFSTPVVLQASPETACSSNLIDEHRWMT